MLYHLGLSMIRRSINYDDLVKSQIYSLSLAASPEGPLARREGRGRGEGDNPMNSNVLFSPSPSSPPTKGGELLFFTRSSRLTNS